MHLIFEKLLRENVAPLSPQSRPGGDASETGAPARIPTPRTEDCGDTVKQSEEEDLRSKGDSAEDEQVAQVQSSTGNDSVQLLVKLLVPIPLCGIIIGKGGSTIKAISTDTSTIIRVTIPQDLQQGMPMSHRIVTINGTVSNVLKAIAALVIRQSADSKFHQFAELPLSSGKSINAAHVPISQFYPNMGSLTPMVTNSAYPSHANMGMQYLHPAPFQQHLGAPPVSHMNPGFVSHSPGPAGVYNVEADGWATISLQLTNDQRNALFGTSISPRSGSVSMPSSSVGLLKSASDSNIRLEEIESTCGVQIRIEEINTAGAHGHPSMRGMPTRPSSSIAGMTITGSPEGVHYAHYLLLQRLSSLLLPQQIAQQHYCSPHPGSVVLAPQNGVAGGAAEWRMPPTASYIAGPATIYPSGQHYAVQAYMHQKYGRTDGGSNKPSPRTHTPRQLGEHM